MDWANTQNWKNCAISTSICLAGCSIGTMGVALYLPAHHWFFVLLISLGAGLISCMLFMIAWHMVLQKMSFQDSLKSSFKMSVVSMLIMMLTENMVVFLASKLFPHPMHLSSKHDLPLMVIAMLFGFLFSLPYNYYHIQRTGQICH